MKWLGTKHKILPLLFIPLNTAFTKGNSFTPALLLLKRSDEVFSFYLHLTG
jgi:hypothetical protein